MLFTTAAFLLLYLPLTLLGFYAIGRRSPQGAAAWLMLASVVFYGYWMPEFVLLLLGSITVNFTIGRRIVGSLRQGRLAAARRWFILGIVLNLAALAYFKYANFFVENLDALFGVGWKLEKIILPIGISFYTFTQIAFLFDAHAGKVNEANPLHYGLFVTYFPHLIAGPVLHHAQMMPQFAEASIYRPRADRLIGGLAILALGLFKKVVLADGIAPYADAVFGAPETGAMPGLGEAWVGALAYTLQLYFDFSGYSDMAIGLSWMFNVRLPFNFDSPYRAQSIADFWRRWHMSLSNFLRDYLYIPLGGNRGGETRRYLNLAVTMVLGGLWHGASWLFVAWGALHGMYLVVNHGYRAWLGPTSLARLQSSRVYRGACWALTLLAVVVAWVFFRAASVAVATRMLSAMFDPFAATAASADLLWNAGLPMDRGLIGCLVLGAAVLYLPNSNRIGAALLARLSVAGPQRPMLAGALLGGVALLLLINATRDSVSAFIYFNF